MIEKSITGSLKLAIDEELNAILSNMPLTIDIAGTPLAINYTLPYAPIVTSNFIQVDTLGLIVDKQNPNLNPPIDPPVKLPGFQLSGLEIQALLSDYTFNSGFYSAYEAGILRTVISQSELPENIKLTTTFLDDFLPGIERKYGANKPCELDCSALESPVLHTKKATKDFPNGQIIGEIIVGCEVIVIDEGTAVVLQMVIDYNATVYIEQWVLNGELAYMQVTQLVAVNNTIDDIDTQGLMDAINFFLDMTLPNFNERIFGKGIPLPKTPYVNLDQSEVEIQEGFLYIQATPVYNYTNSN